MSGLDLTLEPERQLRRFEVITGAGGRRRWTMDDRARILAEALEPGAVVSEAARRHGLTPQQVFTWRRQARKRAAAEETPPAFVPAAVEPPVPKGAEASSSSRAKRRQVRPAAAIELEIDGATVRIGPGADAETVAAVIRAPKAGA